MPIVERTPWAAARRAALRALAPFEILHVEDTEAIVDWTLEKTPDRSR
jgi:hypothetical protein